MLLGNQEVSRQAHPGMLVRAHCKHGSRERGSAIVFGDAFSMDISSETARGQVKNKNCLLVEGGGGLGDSERKIVLFDAWGGSQASDET